MTPSTVRGEEREREGRVGLGRGDKAVKRGQGYKKMQKDAKKGKKKEGSGRCRP